MQRLLDTLHDLCKRWRVLINTDKSKVVHFRKGRRQRTEFVFTVGENILEVTRQYKCLGVFFLRKVILILMQQTWHKEEVERLVQLSQSYVT